MAEAGRGDALFLFFATNLVVKSCLLKIRRSLEQSESCTPFRSAHIGNASQLPDLFVTGQHLGSAVVHEARLQFLRAASVYIGHVHLENPPIQMILIYFDIFLNSDHFF